MSHAAPTPAWWQEVSPPERERLLALGFEPAAMEALRQGVRCGQCSPERNRLAQAIEPPGPAEVVTLPRPDEPRHAALHARGLAALAAGRVAVVILNGGMATRFGGVVKGTVEVLPGRSFLQLKLDDVRAWQERSGAQIPVVLLNSFATDEATRAHLADASDLRLTHLMQGVGLRLTAGGEIHWEAPGRPALYAPGHGDLLAAWRRCPDCQTWSRRPGSLALIYNVDNVLAGIDPAIIGAHLESGCALTVETVRKAPGDVGGAPARVGGRLQIVEGFRFPPAFDQDRIAVFSTNSFVVDAATLAAPCALSWFYVTKQAEGRPVVQLEQLFNELTAHAATQYLEVPRAGPGGRFLPVKVPEDLAAARAALQARSAV